MYWYIFMNNFYVLFAYVLCMAHWIFFPSRWRIIGAFLTACWIIMVVTTISLQFNYIWYFSCLSQFFIYKDGCFCILFFHYHSDICLFFLFIHCFPFFSDLLSYRLLVWDYLVLTFILPVPDDSLQTFISFRNCWMCLALLLQWWQCFIFLYVFSVLFLVVILIV